MKLSPPSCNGPNLKDPAQRKECPCSLLPLTVFICLALFAGSPYIFDYKQKLSSSSGNSDAIYNEHSTLCKDERKPSGGESLPRGIICRTSNLELWPMGGSVHSLKTKGIKKNPRSLLAIAVGIRQKDVVNQIVQKFILSNFTIMLFHYDGAVDEWKDLNWTNSPLHVSAINQTKWWFAKRFLHPDIVAEYDYIFLWDEDLGVENFHPGNYISIIEKEKLEISQPALDTDKSVVHHQITARGRKGDVHRRIYKYRGGGRCYENSTAPPCTGWVEMMAPVFSRTAWQCVWLMIQNDLIHAWGLDKMLGYCAQGDRTQHVGVVDKEYIVHLGIPTLGMDHKKNTASPMQASIQLFRCPILCIVQASRDTRSQPETPKSRMAVPSASPVLDDRPAIRMRSFTESEIFKRRWRRAVAADKCWTDPYPEPKNQTGS